MGNKKIRRVVNATDNLKTDNLKQIVEAMASDIASRDTDGSPKVGGGRIGNTDYGFDTAHLIGGVKIVGDANTVEFSTTDTFTVPADVYGVYVVVGGAGSYSSSIFGGSGGGTAIAWVPVEPGDEYDITISGGTATFGNTSTPSMLSASGASGIRPGKGTGVFSLFPLLVAGGAGRGNPYHSQGTIFAPRGIGGGAGYKAGATAGGGYTAASGTTPGAAGVSITYYT